MIDPRRGPRQTLISAMLVTGCMLQFSWTTAQAEPTMQDAVTYDAPSLVRPAPDDAPKEFVRYDDLDLSSAQDIKSLIGRIREAAKDVCDRQSIEVLRRLQAERECEDLSFSRGMHQVAVLIRQHRRIAR